MPRPRLLGPSALLLVVALVLALGPAAPGLAAATAEAGEGQAGTGASIDRLSPTLQTTDRLDDRRFVVAGDRAYDVGTEAGRYPGMGFHTRGEMSGIWTPPTCPTRSASTATGWSSARPARHRCRTRAPMTGSPWSAAR